MSANVELVRAIFGDWERGDFSSVDWADPEIEFSIPGPDSNVHRGIESMSRAWAEWLGAFEEFSVVAEDFHDAGDKSWSSRSFAARGRAAGYR
jgi:ketosteroid isomerase-like protein